jgi:deazaflavin-dependent oxidoreductase (nitroreductase family)
MLRKIGEPSPPKGLKLKLFRVPIIIYRMRLGFLFGERFVLLKHWGRVSGDLRETVIEVIYQDKPSGKIYSASGFGDKSQWFKNISANSNVLITIKNTEHDAVSRVLLEREAEDILLRYAKSNPRSIKAVARLSGYEMDGSKTDIIEFSSVVKIIEFKIVNAPYNK